MSRLRGIGVALDEMAHANFFHPFTSIAEQRAGRAHVMASAEGIRIRDAEGREYIDAMAGLWCVNVGYGRKELSRAMAEQSERLAYFHSFMGVGNEPAIRLSGALADLAPGKLNRVFFGNSGSDANDTQIKLIWYYNNLLGRSEKKKIMARYGGYHGVTLATASLSGLPHLQKSFDLPLERFIHVGRPHHFWDAPEGMSEAEFSRQLAKELEERILKEGPETIAAFIAEPVQGAGAVIVPPEGYFDAIVPVLRTYDILLIADEVVCGFGRLGKMFGSDYYGFEPDLMTVAKGLTSGYVPMSACIVNESLWEVLADAPGPFAHGYTYTAHPVSAAVALANLDVIEGEGLVANSAEVGAYLQQRLREAFAEHPMVGQVRGVGLIAAMELVASKAPQKPFDLSLGMSKRLYARLLEQGLICRPIFNSLCFSPPLIVSREDVDEIVARFERGFSAFVDDAVRDGLWSPS